MIAVIIGLVAVVLLVLVVVAAGMRSMNRRESNLPPERLRKMAEQADNPNAKRPGRPAEDTFFESFPEGFDAFTEPERATARLRPGNGRPSSRPAGRPGGRPAPRGKQAAGSRGRRGVDEWGDADDYDDDYWTRVRADDGAFGGTIAARMGASRPDLATPSAADAPTPAPAKDKGKEEVDAHAATVQAPLPTRPSGLADLVEPARNTTTPPAAAERTVTFSAPVPPTPAASAAEVLGAIGASQPPARPRRGSRPDPADPLGIADASRAKAAPRRRPDAGGDPGRATPGRGAAPGRGADPRRGGVQRAADAGRPDAGRTGSGRPVPGRPEPARGDSDRGVTGPFTARRPGAGPAPADRTGADPLSTGPLTSGPLSGGPMPTGALAGDPLSSGPLSSGSVPRGPRPGAGAGPASGGPLSRGPVPGGPSSGVSRSTGPMEAPRGAPGAFDAGRSPAGPYDAPRAADTARGTGSFPPAASNDPLAPPAAGGSWPAQPAYPAPGAYDILDGPTPASGSSKETWQAADYQLPAYDGYANRDGYPAETQYTAPPAASASSYEVRPGWATIDDSDSAGGQTAASGGPTGPARAVSPYDTPSGRDLPPSQAGGAEPAAGPGYDGYEPDRYSAPGSPTWSQSQQNTGGSWPSYGELYGTGGAGPDQSTQSSQASPSRGGHRRKGETDYPDYYR